MTEEQEEQKWLKDVQRRLKKYISSPYWDDIKISDAYMSIVIQIMQTTNVKKLSPSINERITDQIFRRIKEEMQRLKGGARGR